MSRVTDERAREIRGMFAGDDPDNPSLEGDLAADLLDAWDEIARLRAWTDDLQSGMYVNCVYCGHRYGPGETTPVSMADALKAHIEVCPEHPMSKLRADRDKLRAEVEAKRHSLAQEIAGVLKARGFYYPKAPQPSSDLIGAVARALDETHPRPANGVVVAEGAVTLDGMWPVVTSDSGAEFFFPRTKMLPFVSHRVEVVVRRVTVEKVERGEL